MSNDFGSEFISLREILARMGVSIPTTVDAPEVEVRDAFVELRRMADALVADTTTGGVRGLIFEIPPGRFKLSKHEGDGPGVRSVYELPENVQLYVCQGALIRPAFEVDLVIRGSLRAGMFQIFGYDRKEALPTDVTNVGTAPMGHILFATRLVRALYPEWWGATPSIAFANGFAPERHRDFDNTDALQAAIDAACVTRDYPHPSLPVLLGGPYITLRDLTVNVTPEHGTTERHLILRGRSGVSTANLGVSTIQRFRDPHTTAATPDDADSWDCLLRLGPNVSFEFEDIKFGIGDDHPLVHGCIDILRDKNDTAPRRGLFRRCSIMGAGRYALRIRSEGDPCPGHFFFDSGVLAPGTPSQLSLYGIEVVADDATMLHVDGAVLGLAPIGVSHLPDNATMHLTGGSVLVAATQFHNGSGPRPSRGDEQELGSIALERPDGQEVFLAGAGGQKATTHFTALQVEDQGWWFLSRPQHGDDQVVLMNVAHNNVNWRDEPNKDRIKARGVTGPLPTEGAPPSLVWLGKGGQCVLLGCRFYWSIVTDGQAVDQLFDVGTMFVDTPQRGQELTPAQRVVQPWQNIRLVNHLNAVIRPPFYRWRSLDAEYILDFRADHVVPIRDFGESS